MSYAQSCQVHTVLFRYGCNLQECMLCKRNIDIDLKNTLGLKRKLLFPVTLYPNKFLFKRIPTLKFFLPSQLPIKVKHA